MWSSVFSQRPGYWKKSQNHPILRLSNLLPNRMKSIFTAVLISIVFWSCDSKPKVIEATEATEQGSQPMADESATKLHKVVVEEVLPTSRYTYLNVTEDGQTYWIAIPKKEVEKGGTYYYRGGLKKVNFKSQEYDRVFETLYLVSDVSKEPGMIGMGGGNPHENVDEAAPTGKISKIDPPAGGITIADLFAHRDKYEGQTVRVKGRVVKLNNMIMNRNWIHIQDGSSSKGDLDLTITTTENVPMGAVVAFEGKIALNRDFGAGYKYEIIMEEAQLLQ